MSSSFYYKYDDVNPSTLNAPNQGHWENPADYPRTFTYIPAYSGVQGLHPPAPVYQSNQPTQTAMCWYPGNTTSPAGYYYNGCYYGTTLPPATGWPYKFSTYTCSYLPAPTAPATNYFCSYQYSPYYTAQPTAMPIAPFASPWYATTATAQAAAALAANATLSQMPNAPAYFVGATAAEIQAQNAIIAANMMAQGTAQAQMPNQLVPYKPGASQQFWCKELDGSWTLREHNDVITGDLGPGHWERHPTSGYYYYVKHPA